MLHVLKTFLSAITLVFSEPPMTSNRYPAERFGRAQNGLTFDRQNTIFAASKTLDEMASGRLNPNIWDHWRINKHIRQNCFFSSYIYKHDPSGMIHQYCFFSSAQLMFILQLPFHAFTRVQCFHNTEYDRIKIL